MQFRNNLQTYGLISVLVHWLVALAVLGLFGLGLWMTSLTYYDPWYRHGPALHKSVGVILFMVMLFRIAWLWVSPPPPALENHSALERISAHAVHMLLYLLLFVVMLSGYLISTADGRSIEVFRLFSIPATLTSIPDQEDIAGVVHLWLAIGLIGLVVLHAAGAVKHHLLDKDRTLKRMLGR